MKKKTEGYQPESSGLTGAVPPHTGSHVQAKIPLSVELKAEAEHWCPHGEGSLVRHCVHDKEACRDCPVLKGKLRKHAEPVFNNAKYDYETGTYTVECDGKKYMSRDGEHWHFDVADPTTVNMLREAIDIELKLPKDMLFPDSESGTQAKIREITDAMKDLLLYKNEKYGDSAINPKKIFYKGDSTNSILIRLDDKLGRVTSNTEEKPRVNDVCDIIGYCTLLLVSMGVTKEDIEKFKD